MGMEITVNNIRASARFFMQNNVCDNTSNNLSIYPHFIYIYTIIIGSIFSMDLLCLKF